MFTVDRLINTFQEEEKLGMEPGSGDEVVVNTGDKVAETLDKVSEDTIPSYKLSGNNDCQYPAQKLPSNQNNTESFENIKEIEGKIIMSNNGGNFIIFDKKTENIVYESKKGDSFIEMTKEDNGIRYKDANGLFVEYDLNLAEEKYDDYKYKKTLFLRKKIFPSNDMKAFIESPLFGDFLNEALKKKFKKKGKTIIKKGKKIKIRGETIKIKGKTVFEIDELEELLLLYYGTFKKEPSKVIFSKKTKSTFSHRLSVYINNLQFTSNEKNKSISNKISFKKYVLVNRLNKLNKEEDSKYLKLALNKFIEIDEKVKIGGYISGKEILTGGEYLVKLDKKRNIEHVIKKEKDGNKYK
ncbi:MAG: hypothetical protein Q9M94_05205 [Candidatus Gracilibacteria bacterium]|nr:hypothetical protein [Candidatus Gracilibacteria bacterium]